MSAHNGTLDTDTGMAFTREPTQAGFVLDEERILDADEIAAELVPDALVESKRARRPPAPRRGARAPIGMGASGASDRFGAFELSAANSQRPNAPAPLPIPSKAVSTGNKSDTNSELQALRLELARVQSRMRARDAYLAEVERALDASSRQLAAAGLASVEDAYALLGRVRGQAFRIAELESELRHSRLALSRVHEPARAQVTQLAKVAHVPHVPHLPLDGHGHPKAPARSLRTEPTLPAE